MINQQKISPEEIIGASQLEQIDLATVQYLFKMSAFKLDSSRETCIRVIDRCLTILGWILAALASLAAALVVQITSGQCNVILMIMTGYALACSCFLSIWLISHALYKVSTYSSGEYPNVPIRKEVLDFIKGRSDDEKHKLIIGCQLNQMKRYQDFNENINRKLVRAYRITLWLLLAMTAFAFILLALLYFTI